MDELCAAYGLRRSSYYYQRRRAERVDTERERLKARVVALHKASRGAAGARSLSAALKEEGEAVGRYKAASLMVEAGVQSKQRRPHRYRKLDVQSAIAPNHLNREFVVTQPNHVWCGDVTYIWAGNCWVYLAVVLDLYARRVVGWAFSRHPDSALIGQALALAYQSRRVP